MFTFKRFLLFGIYMIALCGFGRRIRRRFGRGVEMVDAAVELTTNKNDLQRIEQYLVDKLPRNEIPLDNLEALELWSQTIDKQDESLSKSVSNLMNLPELSRNCDKVGFVQMLSLLMLTKPLYLPEEEERGQDKTRSGAVGYTRLSSIVKYFIMEHSQLCLKKLPKMFEKKYSSLNKLKCQAVENAFNRYLGSFGLPSSSSSSSSSTTELNLKATALYQLFIANSRLNLNRNSDAQLINYGLMITAAGNDVELMEGKLVIWDESDKKPKLDLELYKSLYVRDLVEPCEYYVEELYPDFFSIARYSIDQLGGAERWRDQVQEEDKEFYLAWSRVNLSSLVLSDTGFFSRMLEAEQNTVAYLIKNKLL